MRMRPYRTREVVANPLLEALRLSYVQHIFFTSVKPINPRLVRKERLKLLVLFVGHGLGCNNAIRAESFYIVGMIMTSQNGLIHLFLTVCIIFFSLQGIAQVSITLSDTVSFNSSRVGESANRFGIGNRVISTIQHYEGKTLIQQPIGEFRDRALRREMIELSQRHIALDGSVTQGANISRQFSDANEHFNGTREWIGWTAIESPLGSGDIPKLITEIFDDTGTSIAKHEIFSYQREIVELFSTRTATSRYGSYMAVAVLSSRRKDRIGVREEAGANLTVACISAEGELVFRHTYELPDLRSKYGLNNVKIDESGEAIVLLTRTPWRIRPLSFEEPPIDIVEFLLVNEDTKGLNPIDVLPKGYQPRGIFPLDQEPYPAGFAIAFANNLVEPPIGFQLIQAGNINPIQILLKPNLVANLPSAAIEASKSGPRYINGQYAPTEVRLSPDGRLFVLFTDIFSPLPTQDATIFQWRRVIDGLKDGVVLAEIDFSELSPKQSAHFLSIRQRSQQGFGPFLGSCLVPINGGYGVLYNEDPENLGPGKRKRRPFTRMSFAKPFLAYLKAGTFVREEIEYYSPHRFGVLAIPSGKAIPGGKLIAFSAVELGFQFSQQYFFWSDEFRLE